MRGIFKTVLTLVVVCAIGSLQAVPTKTKSKAGAKSAVAKAEAVAVPSVPFAIKQKAKKFKTAQLTGVDTLSIKLYDTSRSIPSNKPFSYKVVVSTKTLKKGCYTTGTLAQQNGKYDGLVMFKADEEFTGTLRDNISEYMALCYFDSGSRINKDLDKIFSKAGEDTFITLYLMLQKANIENGINDYIAGKEYCNSSYCYTLKDFMTEEDYDLGNGIVKNTKESVAESWKVSESPARVRKADITFEAFVYKAKLEISTYYNYSFSGKGNDFYSFRCKILDGENDEHLYGYISRSSDIGNKLFSKCSSDKEYTALVKFKYPKGTRNGYGEDMVYILDFKEADKEADKE